MKRSTERILTTHAGSLPRPREILDLVEGRDQREVLAVPGADQIIGDAVKAVVQRQVQAGIDVPTDGEMGRVGFSAYATERLAGFDGAPRPMPPFAEVAVFPEFFAEMALSPARLGFPSCTGPITWRGAEFIERDIARLKAALSDDVAPAEVFMPAVSPGQIWLNFANEYYPSDEAFVFAAAEGLANEYRAIVDAGFILQLDDPGLAMGWSRASFVDRTIEDYQRIVAQHVEAINHALEGIPPDRVR